MSNLAVVSADNGNLRMETETISKNGASSKSHTSRRNFLRNTCVAFFAAGFILSGCGKDKGPGPSTTEFEDGKITVTMDDDGYKVAKIVASVNALENGTWQEVEIASAPFINGGFTLNLPDPPANKFLLRYSFGTATVVYEGAEPSFVHIGPYMQAYNSAGKYECELAYGIWDKNVIVYFYYVNKDVTVSGMDGKDTYDLKLKQGWNMVYFKYDHKTESSSFTTTPINGVTWYFFEFGS